MFSCRTNIVYHKNFMAMDGWINLLYWPWKAVKSFLNTSSNLCSMFSFNSTAIITGLVPFPLKNAYLKHFGNSFNTRPSEVSFSFSTITISSLSSWTSIVSANSNLYSNCSSPNWLVGSYLTKQSFNGSLSTNSLINSIDERIRLSILKHMTFSSSWSLNFWYKLNLNLFPGTERLFPIL